MTSIPHSGRILAFLKTESLWLPVFLVFLLGLAVRIFAFQNTYIINSDGVLYIHQARALYYGNRDALVSCYMSYISVLPFFIAGVYTIVHDWLIAGKLVSLFFGFLTLFPVFFLLRRFLKEPFALFGDTDFCTHSGIRGQERGRTQRSCLLVFSEPWDWFLFVQQMDGKKNGWLLILSCFSFLMAGWARIEAVYFIAVSAGAILFSRQDNKFARLAFFCMPIVLLMLLLIPVMLHLNLPIRTILRSGEIANKLYAPFLAYADIREKLSQLIDQPEPFIFEFFLQRARRLVWFIGLGGHSYGARKGPVLSIFPGICSRICRPEEQDKTRPKDSLHPDPVRDSPWGPVPAELL